MQPGSAGENAPVSTPKRVWTRPGTSQSPADDDGMLPFDDLHFHRYCAVWPYLPDDDPALDSDETERGRTPIRFLSGLPRTGLRHTPWIIFGFSALFLLSAETVDHVQGVLYFVPRFDQTIWAAVLVALVLNAILIALVVNIGVLNVRELYTGAIVYGLLGTLTVGTIASAAIVGTLDSPSLDHNIIFTSGYLLTMLLGGLLVYDGMLRTEYMFENLGDTEVVADPDRYAEFQQRLAEDFSHAIVDRQVSLGGRDLRLRIPTVYAFSILFVVPYVVTWSIGVGPQNLDFAITLWSNVFIDVFVIAVFFQFVVLINRFYDLITEDLSGDGNILTYQPFHPDGHGGYRAFGKFATRVNVILIIAGFYSFYRLIVQGGRVTPAEMAPGFDPVIGSLLWTYSFVIPIVVYAIAAIGWFYYSFWQIHLRMIREREHSYVSATEAFATRKDWEIRLDGPTWPTNFNQLVSVIGGTLAPIALFLVEIL